MATVSISVSDDLKKRMDAMDETNWSAVARKAFEEHAITMETLARLRSKSKLTTNDARKISEKIDQNMMKHFQSLTSNEASSRRKHSIQRNNKKAIHT
ncbi:MAG: hypothetical protein ABIA93_03175 [Candidatus Woesearchaeota archaeon]